MALTNKTGKIKRRPCGEGNWLATSRKSCRWAHGLGDKGKEVLDPKGGGWAEGDGGAVSLCRMPLLGRGKRPCEVRERSNEKSAAGQGLV